VGCALLPGAGRGTLLLLKRFRRGKRRAESLMYASAFLPPDSRRERGVSTTISEWLCRMAGRPRGVVFCFFRADGPAVCREREKDDAFPPWYGRTFFFFFFSPPTGLFFRAHRVKRRPLGLRTGYGNRARPSGARLLFFPFAKGVG